MGDNMELETVRIQHRGSVRDAVINNWTPPQDLPDNHPKINKERLYVEVKYSVEDIPPWKTVIIQSVQQVALCATSMIIFPFLIAEAACAGNHTDELRVQLIASTYVVAGLSTFLQTSIGLRLPIMQGTALSFLPPILVWKAQKVNVCPYNATETVPTEFWEGRMQELGGSLALASIVLILVGATGLMGVVSRYIGPITIFPIFLLVAISAVPTMEQKMAEHWISIVTVVLLGGFMTALDQVHIPIPYLENFRKPRIAWIRFFGMFPYLLGVAIPWLICYILTVTNAIPPGNAARTDQYDVVSTSRWFDVPYPGQFGTPKLNTGLFLGFLACCLSVAVECASIYEMAARVCEQRKPPLLAVSRALCVEGIGTALAALMGVGVGVSAYSKNTALMRTTGITSRIVVQITGAILIIIGFFSKVSAILATIPDPIVGSVLCISMAVVVGVAMGNLSHADLTLSRNVTIIGMSIIVGTLVPTHFNAHPIDSGDTELNNILNQVLTIQMLVGGFLAAFLDNVVPGATRMQRGLERSADEVHTGDAYKFPPIIFKPFRWLLNRFWTKKKQTMPI